MNPRLDCILLIDDDEPTNFLNRMVIEDYGCAKEIVEVTSGRKALDYLQDAAKTQPDLIFLDINMPAMNGWEFLEEYDKLTSEQQGKVVVVMLTTSLNPTDKERAEQLRQINSFMNKPLDEKDLEKVLKENFPELVNQ